MIMGLYKNGKSEVVDFHRIEYTNLIIQNKIEKIIFTDEEFSDFLSGLLSDL